MAYNCTTCGAYVADGTTHVCWGFTGVRQPQTTYSPWFDNAALQRIAAALERLVTLLEPKPKPKKAVRRRG